MTTGMLAGVRVIEIGQILSAPFAGMIFADLGADVIKVEKPDGGDDQRRSGPVVRGGDAMAFHDMNRGKRSVVIDLKDKAGVAALHRLAADADVLVHNMRPGSADVLGIGGAAMTAEHSRLVYCEVSGFGHRGPLREQPAFEPIAQAFSGICSVNGQPDGPPARIGCSVVDFGTGMWSVIGILAALHRRAETGRGCVVNASLFETALTWAAPHISGLINLGREPARYGTAHPTLIPYQAFEASDAPLMIAAGNDRLFVKLATILGHPEWATDERFSTNNARLARRELIVAMVADVVRGATRAEWLTKLSAAGVPCAPLNTIAEAIATEQATALAQIRPNIGGDLTLVGLPLSFDGERPAIRGLAPKLGADTEVLLA